MIGMLSDLKEDGYANMTRGLTRERPGEAERQRVPVGRQGTCWV